MRFATATLVVQARARDAWASERLQFEAFKVQHGRAYASGEEERRFQNFRESLRLAARYNAEPEDAAEYGVTRWADRDVEELRTRCGAACTGANCTRATARRGARGTAHAWDGTCHARPRFPELCDASSVPEELDWTSKGAVVGIKDQGECGNCFTFGATTDMEAAWFLAGNALVALSEQQLTSCDSVGGDGGCDGGDTNLDTDKYASKHGVTSEENYPYSDASYTKGKSGTCKKAKEAMPVAEFTDGYQISGGVADCSWCNKQPIDEEVMKRHLATAGPFTIAINAMYFNLYRKGIMNPPKGTCPGLAMSLNHQVAIVGYGSEGGMDYWKIRNSWGTDWGEDGYARIVRGENKCGVAADATHVVAKPGSLPPAPTPPAPTPPSPGPGDCPGGSLKACIGLCPVSPDAVYTACVEHCGDVCLGTALI